MNDRIRGRLAALAAGLVAALGAEAQLFKCVTPDGRVVYQDSRCDDAAKQSSVRPPVYAPAPVAPAPAAGAKSAPAAAPAAPRGANALEMVAGYSICAERVPNFAFKYSAAYGGWKMRNAAAVDQLSNEPDASRLDARMREERARPATENIAERCADVATALQPPATAAK